MDIPELADQESLEVARSRRGVQIGSRSHRRLDIVLQFVQGFPATGILLMRIENCRDHLQVELRSGRVLLCQSSFGIPDGVGRISLLMTTGKLLFAGLFEQLNAERSSVMGGLERVTRKQRQSADKIRTDTLALQALQDATPPDRPQIDALSNQLLWETRIFEDRRRVVKFVCDVPTTIDQRLFALGRTIQQEIE